MQQCHSVFSFLLSPVKSGRHVCELCRADIRVRADISAGADIRVKSCNHTVLLFFPGNAAVRDFPYVPVRG
jgi:hypothetical protein